MDEVKLGRIVHFVLANGEHRPAIIVRVWPGEYGNDEVKDGINAQVFLDGGNDRVVFVDAATTPPTSDAFSQVTLDECTKGSAWRTSVRHSSEAKPGTWHWPERAA